jgi:hypothetical protein
MYNGAMSMKLSISPYGIKVDLVPVNSVSSGRKILSANPEQDQSNLSCSPPADLTTSEMQNDSSNRT